MLSCINPEEKIYSRANLEKYSLTSEIVQKNVRALVKKDIVDKANGSYKVCDVFFRLWISRDFK
jgi:hypothetical protein